MQQFCTLTSNYLCFRPRKTHSITICRPFKENGIICDNDIDSSSPQTFPLKVHSSLPSQILFVPNPCSKQPSFKKAGTNEDLKTITCLDQLSQESGESQSSLMFACPIDKDDDDDDLNSVFDKTLLSTNEKDCIMVNECGVKDIDFAGEIDVFDTETLDLDTSISSFGEEQGILTPAYYDPDTGTVTLLLPSLNPEI